MLAKHIEMIGISLSLLMWAMFCGGCGVESAGQGLLGGADSPEAYVELKSEVAEERDSLAALYAAGEEKVHLEAARLLIRERLERDLIPSWYGTVWDYNGISETPREGLIACGYFVSTLLRDVGYSLERYKLAQQASLNIVKSLSPKGHRWDWSGIEPDGLADRMKEKAEGFYVVGLDNHVGFMLVDGEGESWFLHSSYLDPGTVVREKVRESAALELSNRYVVGYLESDWLLKKWLKKEKIATVKG